MRVAVVSDVHSNLPALEAVLRHADAAGAVDGLWCTGDIVGYGASPSEVISLLRGRAVITVAGNHDLASCGAMSTEEFNPVAEAAVEWTAEQLTPQECEWLYDLKLVETTGDWTLVHGSLRAPEWEYLLDTESASAHLALQTTPYSIVGHSHLPFFVIETPDDGPVFRRVADGDAVELPAERLIGNPGSVGQPRDGDPRASYLLYDDASATITWHRIEYDVAAAQRAIVDAGLPRFLAERLAMGK
jgi:diadenosine tetraphosphatase ApaH/serine/threonine PP2A family protein phosphatase